MWRARAQRVMVFRACERRRAVEINDFSCFFSLAHGTRKLRSRAAGIHGRVRHGFCSTLCI